MLKKSRHLVAAFGGVLAVVAACTSYGEDEPVRVAPNDAASPDAADDGASATPDNDASPIADAAVRRCAPSSPFTSITRIDSLSTTEQELSVRLTSDELVAVVARGADFFVSSRRSTGEDFDVATPLNTINTTGMEAHAMISGDGFLLIFDSDRDGGIGKRDLWTASRQNTIAPFGNVTLVPNVNDVTDDMMPYLLPNGRLYFASPRGLDGVIRIYTSTRVGVSFTAPARALADLTPPSFESHPVVTTDDLEIFFAAGNPSSSNAIFHAARSDPSSGFGTGTIIPELDDLNANDRPSWISPDGCRLYLTSDRNKTTPNDYDVYVASRKPPSP